MRVSVDMEDPGFHPRVGAVVCEVFLNGDSVPHVITADDSLGLVIALATDNNGNFVMDDSGEMLERWTFYGQVEITFRPGFSYNDLVRNQ